MSKRWGAGAVGSGLAAPWRAGSLTAVAIVVTLGLGGCAGAPKRPVLTEAQLQERSAADAAEMGAIFQNTVTKVMDRLEERMKAHPSEPPTLNFLGMSGGGDFGAFGAGFLVGWGEVKDPTWRRPDFDVVTGVSTGALLAPFAYIGTDEACLTVEEFYRNPKNDWIKERGMFFFMPSNPSFATIPGLERDVRSQVNAEFIGTMAEQSRAGKALAISATDLDFGRQRFWEVGAESEAAVSSGDYDKVQRIMLASAAIPGVFPPIRIGDSIYADGGVTANVFLRLDARNPQGFVQRWRKENPDKPFPRVRYWVIINNQMVHTPATVQERWPAVVGPSLETSIRSATLAEVRWLAAEANHVNALYDTDIEVHVVAIPDDWRPPVQGAFKQETMVSLADLGRKLGADPKSWMLWAAPEAPDGSRPAR
jgi:predicted acylesterase/phospholipase RssA